MKKVTLARTATATLVALLITSSANAITFDITSDHATGGLGTPPFGTVTLEQNLTTVDVTVHLNTGYYFVSTGAGNQMDFLFNATGVVLGDITVNQNAPYTLFAATGSFNSGSVGSFAFGITGYNGSHPTDSGTQPNGGSGKFNTDIMFHVSGATIADLTQANSLGNIFVADLYSSTTGNTGLADVSTPGRTVPDGGSTMILLGSALSGLGFVARRLKK